MDEIPAACVDDEVFLGPITLREVKLRLKSKKCNPKPTRRHTTAVGGVASKEAAVATQEESIVSVEDDSDVEEGLAQDITTITLSSDSGDDCDVSEPEESVLYCNVKEEVAKSCNNSLRGVDEDVGLGEEDVKEISKICSDALQKESFCYISDIDFKGDHELELPEYNSECLPQNKVHKKLFNSETDYEKTKEDNSFVFTDYEKLGTSTCSFNSECFENDSMNHESDAKIDLSDPEIDLDQDSYIPSSVEKPKPQTKPNKKPSKNKYDYLMSSVGQYIRQKTPMAPPPPPPRHNTAKKPTTFKNTAYKNVVSPLAVYIKSGPTAPLMQNVTPKTMRVANVEAAKSSGKKIASMDNLPKVVYRPANFKMVNEAKGVHLPASVKKICPQNIKCITHKARIVGRDFDVSEELEKTDISCISTSACVDDISVLSVKDALRY